MALFKIGETWYNDVSKPMYLLQGNATKDGENAPVNGKDHGRVSVAAHTTKDGDTIYVTVNGWRRRAAEVAAVRKGESVFAIGPMNVREYNGRNYYDLDADFLSVSGAGVGKQIRSAAGGPAQFVPPTVDYGLIEEDDAQLPF